MRRVSVIVFTIGVVLAAVTVPSGAEDPSAPAGLFGVSPKTAAGDDTAKVDSVLVDAQQQRRAGVAVRDLQEQSPLLSFSGADVLLDISLDHIDDNVEAALEAAGLSIVGSYPEYGRVSGRASLDALDAIAAVAGVQVVHPEYGAVTNVGAVTSQADATVKADVARANLGVDGSGIEVGVISDSFNTARGGTETGSGCSRRVTGMANQNSGDLPATVGLLDDGPPGSDEGAGMGELITDLAPGADLTFHTARPSQAAFASGITELRTCGADVIVDDVLFFAEPMFQDGPIAQAAQAAVNAGVPYFSSAGNMGRSGIDDRFAPAANSLHDFGGGNRFAAITLGPGQTIQTVMQWSEPFDGALGAGARNDFDLFIVDAPSTTSNALGGSVSNQGCTFGNGVRQGDPLEIATYTNNGPTRTVYLAIVQSCAGAPAGTGDHLRLANFAAGSSVFQPGVFTDAQIYGHAAAAGAVAVAAIDFCEADTDGSYTSPGGFIDAERFTSLGGDIPIYFGAGGGALNGAPRTRVKPEITAPDGTNTTFFPPGGGHGPGCGEDDGFPNFFGTSAAAPHAAAVAALMLERNSSLTPAQITNALQDTARDIETPGFDFVSGAGLINADAALAATAPSCGGLAVTVDLALGQSPTEGDDVIRGTQGKDLIVGLGGDDVICALGGNDTVAGLGGNDTIFGGAGADTLRGGPGNDVLEGEAGIDELFGAGGDDILRGGQGPDVLAGQAGDDTIEGGAGDDRAFAGIGRDRVEGDDGVDRLRGGPDKDAIFGGPDGDRLAANAGDDKVEGGAGDDRLNGGIGDDRLNGGGDDDLLRGLPGNDVLAGGRGFDKLFGGGDRDRCVGEIEVACES